VSEKKANMTTDEANEYIQAVLGDKVAVDGLEAEALKRFRQMSEEQGKANQRLTQINQEVVQLRDGIQRLQGQLDAYAQIIVSAEDARRDSATDGTTGDDKAT
jgi:predicted  nucleic acid-binding Zn-ribbon protein